MSSSSKTSCFSEFETDSNEVARSANLDGLSMFDNIPACSSLRFGDIFISSVKEFLRFLANASI